MRWQHSMADHPALRGVQVDLLYMDTTYAAPKHLHPPQVSRGTVELQRTVCGDLCTPRIWFRHRAVREVLCT